LFYYAFIKCGLLIKRASFFRSYEALNCFSVWQAVILKYEQYLGTDCSGDGAVLDGEDEDRVILSLKGLRNMGITLR
jgi:hypothetical protein